MDDQWNLPNRTDHYLMLIASEVRKVLSKNPNNIKLADFKLKFISFLEKPEEITQDSAAEWSKAKWLGKFKQAGIKLRGN